MSGILQRIICIAALLLVFSSVVCAEGEKITGLVIKGNRRIEAAVILNAIKLKAGDTVSLEQVDSDIRAIYRLGYFLDVKAETEPSERGVVLVYRVEERPFVREIRIEGSKEVAAEKIREAFTLKQGAVFSAKELTSGLKKVKKLYADEGYYLAQVDASTEKRSDTDVRVLLKIVEGEKVLIKKIRFEGNKAFSDKKVERSDGNQREMVSFLAHQLRYLQGRCSQERCRIACGSLLQ